MYMEKKDSVPFVWCDIEITTFYTVLYYACAVLNHWIFGKSVEDWLLYRTVLECSA